MHAKVAIFDLKEYQMSFLAIGRIIFAANNAPSAAVVKRPSPLVGKAVTQEPEFGLATNSAMIAPAL